MQEAGAVAGADADAAAAPAAAAANPIRLRLRIASPAGEADEVEVHPGAQRVCVLPLPTLALAQFALDAIGGAAAVVLRLPE